MVLLLIGFTLRMLLFSDVGPACSSSVGVKLLLKIPRGSQCQRGPRAALQRCPRLSNKKKLSGLFRFQGLSSSFSVDLSKSKYSYSATN